jgi:transcriptional regulator with XRE-family HTH domain
MTTAATESPPPPARGPSAEARRIAELREKTGLSASKLSEQAGLGKNTVGQIESGQIQHPTSEALRKIAAVLGVAPGYLLDGERLNSGGPGMSESNVTPWTPARSGERPDLHERQARLPAILAPRAGKAAPFRLAADLPGFNLEAGDVLIIDLKTPAQTGDLVIATVVDMGTASSRTVLRRFLPPYLVPADSSRTGDVLVVDGARTVVMGPVIASFRAPQID